jgi:hypothetical protein
VRLEAPAAGARFSLSWRDDVAVNGAADPALFRLEPPPGAPVEELPPGGPPPAADLPLLPAG